MPFEDAVRRVKAFHPRRTPTDPNPRRQSPSGVDAKWKGYSVRSNGFATDKMPTHGRANLATWREITAESVKIAVDFFAALE